MKQWMALAWMAVTSLTVGANPAQLHTPAATVRDPLLRALNVKFSLNDASYAGIQDASRIFTFIGHLSGKDVKLVQASAISKFGWRSRNAVHSVWSPGVSNIPRKVKYGGGYAAFIAPQGGSLYWIVERDFLNDCGTKAKPKATTFRKKRTPSS